MRTLTHLLVGAIATTGILAGTAATAVAQDQTIKDKRADVLLYKGVSDPKPSVLNKSKSAASGVDVTKAKFDYTKKHLKVTLTFAKLTKKRFNLDSVVEVKGEKFPTFVISNSGSTKKVTVFNLETGKKACTGKLSRKAGNKGTATFTVSRSCLDKPKALRLMTSVGRSDDVNDPDANYYVDSVSAKKTKEPTYTKWLKAS